MSGPQDAIPPAKPEIGEEEIEAAVHPSLTRGQLDRIVEGVNTVAARA